MKRNWNSHLKKYPIAEFAWVALAFIIAIYLRLSNLKNLPIWFDEAYTHMLAQFPWRTILFVPSDVHPPLYAVIAKLVYTLGGGFLHLRFISFIVGLLIVWGVWRLGRNIAGPACGVAAACFVAVSSTLVLYSQDARSYSILIFIFALIYYSSIKFIDSSRIRAMAAVKKYAAFYGVLAILALYLHIISAVHLLVLNVSMFFILLQRIQDDNQQKSVLIIWLFANIIVAVVWSPWFFQSLNVSPAFDWLPVASFEILMFIFISGLNFFGLDTLWSIPVLGAVVQGTRYLWHDGEWEKAVLLACGAICAPILIWSLGFIKPVFMLRTILPAIIPWCLLFGAFFTRQRQWLAYGLLFLTVIVGSIASLKLTDDNIRHRDDWPKLMTEIEERRSHGETIIMCDVSTMLFVSFFTNNDENYYAWSSEIKRFVSIDKESIFAHYMQPARERLIGKLWLGVDEIYSDIKSLKAAHSKPTLLYSSHCPMMSSQDLATLEEALGYEIEYNLIKFNLIELNR